METAYNDAIKDYTRAKQDEQAAIVAKQLESWARTRVRPGANPLGVEITPEILKLKFAGKATFDEKSGMLELVYRFSDRKELQDFELSDVPPTIVNSSVIISAGQSIKHVVEFDTMSVVGVIGVKEMKGAFLQTNAATVGVGGDGKDTLYLVLKGQNSMNAVVPAKVRKGAIRFGVAITDKRATLYWGNEQLGGEMSEPGAGRVTFRGGDIGFAYGNIVITGKPKRDWAAKFFAASEK